MRRQDGQTIQLTPLLYAVLEAVDGTRDDEQVAEQVGAATGRLVSADDVRTLVHGCAPSACCAGPTAASPR